MTKEKKQKYFDDNGRLLFSHSLTKLINEYDKQDNVLTDQTKFKNLSDSGQRHALKSPLRRTGTGDSIRGKNTHSLSAQHTPLPSLPEDDETQNLRKKVSNLEKRDNELDEEIERIKEQIKKLEIKINNDLQLNIKNLHSPHENTSGITTQKGGRTSTKDNPKTPTEEDRLKDVVDPVGMTEEQLVEYYKRLYYIEQEKLINYRSALEQNNSNTPTLRHHQSNIPTHSKNFKSNNRNQI